VDIDRFIRDGYVAVRGAFDPDTATACRDVVWERLAEQGVTRDRATWTRPDVRIDCPEGGPFVTAGTAPALWAAYDELIGPGRWTKRQGVGGAIPVRFPGEERPGGIGWHFEGSYDVDGQWWTNVRSRGRGLLALFLFDDVGDDDAPTRLVVGSHLAVPRLLTPAGEPGAHGDTVMPGLRPSILCRQVAHATGKAGDVILCHPFLLHTATWPHRGTRPRMMAQPGVEVLGGFAIDGTDPSPIARAIVEGFATDWAN
jgi:hypothetical protein